MTHDLEKSTPMQVEDVAIVTEKSEKTVNAGRVGDYSGAVAKTDEVEIALVRKMDYRIMPTLFAMYFL